MHNQEPIKINSSPEYLKGLKKELERRFSYVENIKPYDKIRFDYFLNINDYIDWIEANNELRLLLHRETGYIAHYYLIKTNLTLENINHLFTSQNESPFTIAYLNLYAVALAVYDLNDKLELTGEAQKDHYFKNRVKLVKHLNKIQNNMNIIYVILKIEKL